MKHSLLMSLLGRGLTMLSTFITIPILIKLLGGHDYGVWVTLTSMIGWYLIFDLGLGNAIRNRVAGANGQPASGADNLPQIVAGTIQIYAIVALILGLATFVAILLVEPLKSHPWVSAILYAAVIISFPLNLSTAVLQGRGDFAKLSLLSLVVPAGWLVVNGIAALSGHISLLAAAVLYSSLLLLQSALIAHSALHRWVPLSSILNLANSRSAYSVVKVGLSFFALQVSSLVLFYAGNFISFQHLDAAEVARFDTVNKIFMLFSTVLNIVISIAWTEAAKARGLQDSARSLRLLQYMLLFSTATSAAAVLASVQISPLIAVVSHGQLSATPAEAWPFALLIAVQCFAYSGAVFLNAYERVTGQLILAVMATMIFIPLSTIAFQYGMGIASVPMATAVVLSPSVVFCLGSAYRLIQRR